MAIVLHHAVAGGGTAGHIARGEGGGQAQAELAVIVARQLNIVDVGLHGGVRRDVGDAHGKQIGAFLLQQGCFFARLFGLFENLLCLGALFDLCSNFAPVHNKSELVYGGVFRQGENISAVYPASAGVGEGLADVHAGHHAVDVAVYGHIHQ